MYAHSKRTTLTLYAVIATVAIVGTLALTSSLLKAQPPADSPFYAKHVPGELLIKFEDGTVPTDKSNLMGQVDGTRAKRFRSGAEHWRLGAGRSTADAIASLRGNPRVKYVEPNYIIEMDVAPNDDRYPELWGMNNTGQTGGTPGVDIDAERAWNVSTGSPDVLVAVIDTGIDYNHPDLAANIWTNPGEIPGNGVDDDGNGFIDDIHGWDFYNDDNDPFDDNGHGTHCSGTIGGVGNNAIGVAGVNWDVTIMGLKFLSGGGTGSTADAVASVDYATMMGVDIMSNSWGGGGFSQTLLDAIDAAAAQEIVFVAAAGNGSSDTDVTPHYPSSYTSPNIISVMATDENDVRSYWTSCACSSNIGATSVDLAAPGSAILSTTPGNTYSVYNGTSMATPHVAGAAALLRAVVPGIPAAQVRQVLMDLADPVPGLAGMSVSGARLNAFFPIADPDDTPPGQITDLAFASATSNSIFLSWTATGDDGDVGTASEYDMRYSTAPITAENFEDATRATGLPAPEDSGTPQSAEVLGLEAGTTYYFAIKAGDEWGNTGPISNVPTGMTLPPPTFASTPDSFTADLLTGQTTTRTLTIENAGVGTLDWSIPLPEVSGPAVVQYDSLDLGKGEVDPRPGLPALLGFGGPDVYGYRWIDSNEAGGPTFTWTDIAMTGTPIAIDGDDQNGGPIALGFDFPFYGTTFDSVRVCTNGWVSLTSSATAYGNQPLPNSGAPENLIAAFWDDLHFRGAQRATYQNVGGNFVIQFTEVDRYATGSILTFQVELQPSGEIRLRYLSLVGVLDNATVGIQNADKTDGLTVTYNAGYLEDNLEIRIAAVPQWLSASPTSGRLYGSETADVTLTIDASGLDGGTYEGSVNVESNDPLQPVVGHLVTLNVTGAPAISVSPLSIDFGQVYSGFSATQSITINNTGTDTLTVSSIVSGDPQVTVDPAALTIPAHSGATVDVTYTPAAPSTVATTLTITSDASNATEVTVDVAGYSLPAPAMIVEPTSFDESLYTGGTVTRNLRVRNAGGSDLDVNLSVELGATAEVPAPSPELPKGDDSDAGTGDNVTLREGGPDAFGYRFKDSDAPGGPTFNWIDISGVGTQIPFSGTEPDDTNYGPIDIGFDFSFYGQTFNTIRACSNGWLSFTSTSTDLSNSTLPGTGSPENLLAAFHDDLRFYTANNARAYYYYDGTRFIVQFENVSKYGQASTSLMNFEVILYPSGKIVYQYLDMSGTLNSSTIGIQNDTRDIGLEVAYNENYVHNNMAIEFARVPDWLAVSPNSATIPPGGFRDFDVVFNAGDSGDRVFLGAVHIDTNIPDPPFVDVPATLTVFGVADVATDPEMVDFETRFVGYPHIVPFYVQNVGTGALTVYDVTSNDPNLFVDEPISTGREYIIEPGEQVFYNLRWLPPAAGPLDAIVTVHSDDPDEAALNVSVIGTAIPAPIFGYSPGSFSESLFVGEVSTHYLQLTNTGGSDLEFNIGVSLTDAVVVPQDSEDLPKGVEPTKYGPPRTEGSGGPDMFGYSWKDSDEAGGPLFDWVDISGIGAEIPFTGTDPDDRNHGPIDIGFDFPFYGQTFDTLRACTNGWLSFTSTSTDLSNAALPGTGAPENLLAVFHDDLRFYGANNAKAYYYNDGTRFIVQYENVSKYGQSSTSLMNFEVILYPSGKIVYQYLNMSGTLTSATVGIQNATRDDGLTIAYNQAYVHDEMAIAIQAAPDWLSVGVASGTVPPGDSVDIPVEFNATELIGGIYDGGLRVTTNDPAAALVDIPATLDVTGFPGIAAEPQSLDFGTVFIGVTSTLPVTISNPGTDVLYVTEIAVSGDYTVDTTPFSLPPYESAVLEVTFAPTTDGLRPGSIDFTSNATGVPLYSVPLAGIGNWPPIAGVDPTAVEAALPPNGSKTKPVELCNTGGSDLVYSATVAATSNVETVENTPWIELPKHDESDAGAGDGLFIDRSGGPDVFGYTFRDSDEPGGPVFDYVDISTIGTPVFGAYGDDRNEGPIPIGFDFPFYGETFNTLNVCTNGWLSFTSTRTTYSNPSTLPNSGSTVPENLLAVFFDDMVVDPSRTGGDVFYHYDGTRLIVHYKDHRRIANFTAPWYDFQVILYPSGKIVYQYLQFGSTTNSATIGIQNGTKDDGLLVSYNESGYLHPEMAIEFSAGPDWINVSPELGVIPAGECETLNLELDSTGLEDGDYEALLTIVSNDPFNSPIDVPVLLHVGYTDLAYIHVDPNTLNLSSNGKTIRAALQLPEGLDPYDIVIETVSIGGQLYANPHPIAYEDENGDGVMELIVKFDRAAFEAMVPEGDSVPVTITGEVMDQTWFIGTDYIRTINPRVTNPNGGEYLVANEVATISWEEPVIATAQSYTVWLSGDDGETWVELAEGLTDTSYTWTVAATPTMQARVRVFALDNQGVMGYDTSDAAFIIAETLNPPAPVDDLFMIWDGQGAMLNWKLPVADLSHGPAALFRVLSAATAAGPFTEIGTTTTDTFEEPIDPDPGPMVFYKVIAVNGAGEAQ